MAATNKNIRVLLVDDHAMVRAGFISVLESGVGANTSLGIKVVKEASSGEEAVEYMRVNASKIDVVVMDMFMEGMGGLAAISAICELVPNAKILVVSMHGGEGEELAIEQAIKAGALGFILKTAGAAVFREAVCAVAAGKEFVTDDVRGRILEFYRSADSHSKTEKSRADPFAKLNQSQRDILELMIKGKEPPQIAKLLGLNVQSVRTYRSNMKSKLGVSTDYQLVVLAQKLGFKNART